MQDELLRVEGLVKYFSTKGGMFYSEGGDLEKGVRVHALDGVSFTLGHGSTLGVVGESGCGKSTLARTLMRLTRPTAGKIFFEGKDITGLSQRQLIIIRANIQMVFQDPFSSLDPRMSARSIISEPLSILKPNRESARARIEEVFQQVGLSLDQLNRFPNEFSGGERQRIAIARALITNPKLVILDEPTSALDASTQAQILNLLKEIQKKYGISYLFISHNVDVVRHMSERIAVMYLGRIVELGSADSVMKNSEHPYTWGLIHSIPKLNPRARGDLVKITGETPSPVDLPPGCRYNPRCPRADSLCREVEPSLEELESAHYAACHHPLLQRGL